MSTIPSKLRTAVIGVGYLGKFHADKYADLAHSELVAIADPNEQHGKVVANKHGVEWIQDYKNLIGKVDAVSIVTPTTLHHKIAKELLEAGIHVLVEKPITVTLKEADELILIARKKGLTLQVGHLERFNAAMLNIKPMLKTPKFIEVHRLAPYKPRATDVNVVLDLMIHDIDIILDIVDSKVTSIAASGTNVLSESTDICNVRLSFANGCIANVTASRISMKSERKMRIFQEKSCITVDFQNQMFSHYYTGKGEMFPGVANIENEKKTYSDGDALHTEIESFLNCIINKSESLVSGEAGRRALDVATQISQLI